MIRRFLISLFLLLLAILMLTAPADAAGCSDPVMRPCAGSANRGRNIQILYSPRRPMTSGLHRVMADGAGRIVAHPRGCPARAFCGCGAAVRIFGKPIRSLWLAANWLRQFPRTDNPAPGTVAVRRDRHHVVVLERHISGSVWIVWDANSGHHRTRVHPRSIAGWVIVDPRAGA